MAQMANRRLAMTLFSGNTCPYCHMVRIVLAEKGINYDIHNVDLGDTPEDLKDLNPYNDVPTLVDRDLVLFQHQVIMEYLDERFPHPPLMPVDPVSRARNRMMLHRIERDWYRLAHQLGNPSTASDKVRKELRDSLMSVSPIFDQKPFFLGEEFSLIDCTVIPLLWRLPSYGIELPSAAKPVIDYAERMFERESFKQSLTEGEKEMKDE
ncbi:MAG: glutathione S-transferase N-terminal domain-containing protein [Thiohalophilus sp.]|uniref:glutathione S-transferase N-terminal domain-containing protein n=1 Tax=Thiohalophilus sp. TaxID=3028392 RepID=UPI00287088A6|nr:glutathione S-transferase N-terminal domain-containing protein [Thiohalophilus sp.]MDR9435709.1 glutathione S-transferase N-terminal domain-containing protein [Thiohalophilus sp.]